ncbi:aminodeoxychorismate synthase component I [Terriglobus roseus]|uniref:Para-aminobenzoate synthetase / 4-amino-4-deoxychorismate lyase n=1 Tax=Terriglobus roseus TaxID=392734 RepID=A0A1G7K1D6_9BACT|nr:aminodeoxychorismate synthase component I [Terriglobus roseus]SDF30960.1 para-aminobenzoate synthetase / 4-amino-4-deoxychorismate lyase [Terriglobus roseus]
MSASSNPWSPLPSAWRTRAFANPGSILLESSLPSATEHTSLLFEDPIEILTANTPNDLPTLFAALEAASQNGHWVAGWMAYEAGAHFLQLPPRATSGPIAIFGIYRQPQAFDHTAQHERETTPQTQPLQLALMPTITPAQYTAAINRIQRWIAAGDTYQVNFTNPLTSPCTHTPQQVYDALHAQQPCSFGAILNLLPNSTILSFSPELFFNVDAAGNIATRPMKGTSPRSANAEEDQALAEALQHDEKNRAEHVMIVDLLRNDMNRICRIGSVHAASLFDIESLPTVHQMTSTIRGQLPAKTPWSEVFRALFPGGSITGAPKRHTVELIQKLEASPRGVYTGAIGYFAPDRSACFNIAIRTAVLENNTLTLGAGGGIVADSTAASEYREMLLKASFVQRASQPIQLIETMRAETNNIALLQHHLQRLQSSAEALGFTCNTRQIEASIHAAINKTTPQRVRLLLHRNGETEITLAPAPAWPQQLRLRLSHQQTRADSPHLRHKTTFRPEYQPELEAALTNGFHDTLFLNTAGEVTESCIATLLAKIDDHWFTPPLYSGVLPGVYREQLIATGLLTERTITLDDLRNATSIALCNALRGIAPVTSLQLPDGEIIHWKSPSDLPSLPA